MPNMRKLEIFSWIYENQILKDKIKELIEINSTIIIYIFREICLERLNYKIKSFCLRSLTTPSYVCAWGRYLRNSIIDPLTGEEQTNTTIHLWTKIKPLKCNYFHHTQLIWLFSPHSTQVNLLVKLWEIISSQLII